MNKLAAGWTIQLLPVAGCPVGTTDLGFLLNGRKRCVLSGTIGANGVPASVRLTAGNYYEISGRVDIGVDRGAAGTAGTAATLTIDPGVTMYGNDSADILIVNRGSQILVNGTAVAPVTTSTLTCSAAPRPLPPPSAASGVASSWLAAPKSRHATSPPLRETPRAKRKSKA